MEFVSLGIKRVCPESDRSRLSGFQDKNVFSCTPTTESIFVDCGLIMHRDILPLIIIIIIIIIK
jgi:hypothetical protein